MRVFDIGGGDEPAVVSDRVLTVPNVLSLLRLAALPFVYLDLASGHHLRALIVLAVVAATDWFDGYIARRFDQVSRIGKLADPISDRLLVIIVGAGMVVGDLIPLWAILVLVARDLVVLGGGLFLLTRRVTPPAVTRIGKSATFGLMTALPLFILASVVGDGAADPNEVTLLIAWALYGVSTALYYVAVGQYVQQARGDLRDARRVRRAEGAPADAPSGDVR